MLLGMLQIIAEELGELKETYEGMMRNLAYRILQNHHSAEDAVQEALISLSSNLDKLDNINSKRSYNYVYTVTKNVALTIKYKEQSRNINESSGDDEFFNIAGEADVNAFANNYGFSNDICDALNKLTPEDRDILSYRYGAGYTPKEIAKYMGKTREYIYKRIQRAQNELRKILSEEQL